MSSIMTNPIKEKNIPISLERIKYHKENPSQLILKMQQIGYCIHIDLIVKYSKDFRHCNLGSFYALACFESIEGMEKLMEKAELKAEKFYEETLRILSKRDYKLYIYDNGNLELIVAGKSWKVINP